MDSSVVRHSGVIATATVVALAVWAVLWLAGVDFGLKKDAAITSVGAIDVVVATIVAGFAAWAAHAVIVRLYWARYWPLIGSAALGISLLGPSRMADGATAVALVAMHVIVAWILIIGFALVSQREGDASTRFSGSLRRHPERG